MKNIFILVFLAFISLRVTAQEKTDKINWVSIEEAVALQKKEPRKIIMDVYTNWCGPCKMLDKNTFQNKDVINYVNTNYYAVKFNAEGNNEVSFDGKTFTNPNYDPTKANRRNSQHQFAGFLRVRAYPTIIFFDEETRLIAPITSYLTPTQIELYLKMFKADEHIEMNSQEKFNAYYEAFKPTFKG